MIPNKLSSTLAPGALDFPPGTVTTAGTHTHLVLTTTGDFPFGAMTTSSGFKPLWIVHSF